MSEQTPEALAAIIEQAMEADDAVDAEVAALSARCTALEQERDQLARAIAPTCHTIEDREHFTLDELVKTARNHRELTNDECEALRSRCQHLEQAVREALNTVNYMESVYRQNCVSEGEPSSVLDELQLRSAALASLLPSQDGTSDAERATFSAGYSQAIDDATRSRP